MTRHEIYQSSGQTNSRSAKRSADLYSMLIFIVVVKMHQSHSMTFKNRPFPRPSNRHVELAALGTDRVEVLARKELVTHEVAHLC